MKIALLSVATLLACESIVFADDAGGGPPGAGAPGAVAPPATAGGWPAAVADRPYNLDAGMVELHGALPIASAEGGDTIVLAGVGASYGISDLIEVGGDYAFQVRPTTDAAGVFAGHVRIRLAHTERVSAALGASVFYSDSLSSQGTTLIGFGASIRYRFNRQLSIFTETNVCGGCINVAGPVMGQGVIALQSGLDGGGSNNLVGFTVPVGIGYQANPQLYLSASTIIGAVLLSPDTDTALEFRDVIPIIASAWFAAAPKVDIGVTITDDLKNAGDNYFFELGARIFL